MAKNDLVQTIGDARRASGEVLTDLSDADWDSLSLCEGWRVREVVAHLTMPVRYRAPQLLAEMIRCNGNFTRMSDLVARRRAPWAS
ncbi:MAG: maleylpyruvate isomerase N-terminal domain-containing protein [Ornithinibacter sp.]